MPDTLVTPRRQVLLGVALGGVAAATVPLWGQADPANAASVEALKALLDAYMKAFSAHDTPAVIKLFAPNAIMVGTGPGEIWGGPEEIAAAHKNFFGLFESGKQKHQSLFRDGHVMGDMAWLVAMSQVSFTKGTQVTEFGLNVSVVFEKTGGTWLIRALHLSNAATAPAK